MWFLRKLRKKLILSEDFADRVKLWRATSHYNIKHFFTSKNQFLLPKETTWTKNAYSRQYIFIFELHINGYIVYIPFTWFNSTLCHSWCYTWLWLIYFHCNRISQKKRIFHCMNLLIHSTADGHLCWFRIWTITNNVVKNILINMYHGTCA